MEGLSPILRKLYNTLAMANHSLGIIYNPASVVFGVDLPLGVGVDQPLGVRVIMTEWNSSIYAISNCVLDTHYNPQKLGFPSNSWEFFEYNSKETVDILRDSKQFLDNLVNQSVSATIALMIALRATGRVSRDMARLIGQFYYAAVLRAARAELGGH